MTKIISNTDIKALLVRAGKVEDEMDAVKAEKKDLNAEIKASGVDMKAFRAALKEIRKPVDDELKTLTNMYLETAGQYKLFA